jgi:hypothetical protein
MLLLIYSLIRFVFQNLFYVCIVFRGRFPLFTAGF